MRTPSIIKSVFVVTLSGLIYFPSPAIGGGNVIGWGGNDVGQTTPCASNLVAIAAGYKHSLLLLEDGNVADCGMFYLNGSDYPIIVPLALSNIVAISAGASHSLALKADLTVVAWGLNTYGQTEVPVGLTNVAAVAAGLRHSLALKMDGTVIGWGDGGTNIPSSITNVVAISAGAGNNLALKADGTVAGWGFRTDQTAALSSLSNVVAISAGDDSNYESWLVLKSNGDVVRQSAYGGISIIQSNAIAISCSSGTDHHISLALKADGTVAGWGYNFYGGPNVPTGLSNVVVIAAGGSHNLALVGGGHPFLLNRLVDTTAVMTGEAYFRIEAAGARPLNYQWKFYGTNLIGATNAVLALSNLQPSQSGSYSVAVSNSFGGVISESALLTLGALEMVIQPASQTNTVGTTALLSVSVQGIHPLVYQWRFNNVEIMGATNGSLILTNLQLSQAGAYSVVVSNAYGTIASSNAILTVVPILITSQPKDAVMFTGGTISFSVAAQGDQPFLYQWQFDDTDLVEATNSSLTLVNVQQDQAGHYNITLNNPVGTAKSRDAILSVVPVATWGSMSQTNVPVHTTNVVAVAAGLSHQLALRADGIVSAWGGNSSSLTNVPAGLTNVVAIASGCYASGSLALKSDGKVVMWGYNSYGHPPLLAFAATLTNVVATAGGQSHMLALKADGMVIAWGDNTAGQTSLPSGLTNIVAIAAGQNHSLALKADGSVRAWGANSYGQTIVPTGLSNAVAVAAGAQHSLALKADGNIIVWGGQSFYGQTNLPVGLSNVVAIAAGEFHSLALKADGSVVVWSFNSNGQTNIPSGLTNVAAIAAGGRNCMALVGDGPPVLQALVENPTWDNNGFKVFVPTQSGRVYQLEYKDSLDESDWKSLPLVAGNGVMQPLIDSTPTGGQRFYRVRRW